MPVLAILTILASGCVSSPEAGPPRVAGQAVPREAISIDFDKRFDIHTRLGNQDTDFNNCKIVGFIEGEEAAGDGSWSPSSKFYSFSRDWLVIEKSDGRRAYVPASSVVYFEDAAQ